MSCRSADKSMVTRRAALALAGFPLALAATPALARAKEAAADSDAAARKSTFSDPYTAWAGYATTAEDGIVPGAVPVSAPASADLAWRADIAGEDASGASAAGAGGGASGGSAAALAIRQIGMTTYVYAATGSELVRLDISTGAETARAKLAAPVPARPAVAFAERLAVVPTASGGLVAFDEDLGLAWESDEVAPSVGGFWDAASGVVSASGVACVSFAVSAGEERSEAGEGAADRGPECVLAGFSLEDGSLLWTLDGPSSGSGAPSVASTPALLSAGGSAVWSAGGPVVSLVDIVSGSVVGEAVLDGDVSGRLARVPADDGDGSFVAATPGPGGSTFSVRVLSASSEGLRAGGACAVEGSLGAAAPVVAGGTAYLAATAGTREDLAATAPARLRAFDLAPALEGGVPVEAGFADISEEPISCLLATAFGEGSEDALCEVYALGESGGVSGARHRVGDLASAEVAELYRPDGGNGPGGAASLLANRDGALVRCAGGSAFALAPDDEHACATPVGGSEGVDTMMGALEGVTLPNGAGLGIGAILLAAVFGVHVAIRSRVKIDDDLADRRGRGIGRGGGR